MRKEGILFVIYYESCLGSKLINIISKFTNKSYINLLILLNINLWFHQKLNQLKELKSQAYLIITTIIVDNLSSFFFDIYTRKYSLIYSKKKTFFDLIEKTTTFFDLLFGIFYIVGKKHQIIASQNRTQKATFLFSE